MLAVQPLELLLPCVPLFPHVTLIPPPSPSAITKPPPAAEYVPPMASPPKIPIAVIVIVKPITVKETFACPSATPIDPSNDPPFFVALVPTLASIYPNLPPIPT
jgi:hypothetical protein